jgi:hypothetical protein
MNTLEIVAKHEELRERFMQYVVWAITFTDKEAVARMKLAKKKLLKFEEIDWIERETKQR